MTEATVVGGGMSGAACAAELSLAGFDVELLDRGHRLGGRMASRTLRSTGTAFDGHVVDIGASYFTADDAHFKALVDRLLGAGVVRRWTNSFHVAGPHGLTGFSTGPMRYAAPLGLQSVVEAIATADGRVHVNTSATVSAITFTDRTILLDGRRRDAVALCMPAPQASRITEDVPESAVTWDPVIAVTSVFHRRHWVELAGVFVNDDPTITWIADDGSRRGDAAPVLVAHVHPKLASLNLDDPRAVIPHVVGAIKRVLGFSTDPAWVDARRWTVAKPSAGSEQPYWLHTDANLGLAGDAWSGGPRVEAAWLSGHALGGALADRLTR